METKEVIGLIIALLAIGGGLGIAYVAIYLTVPNSFKERLIIIENRNKVRLALIEKGMDPSLADKKNGDTSWNDPLFWGLLLAGIGTGALSGSIIVHYTGWTQYIVVNAMGMLFGGLGLITYYIVSKTFGRKKAE